MLYVGIAGLTGRYHEVFRHWDGASEGFAGGDALLTALYAGWKLGEVVRVRTQDLGGNRRSHVYIFELERDNQKRIMPVLSNPYVARLIAESPLQLIDVSGVKNAVG